MCVFGRSIKVNIDTENWSNLSSVIMLVSSVKNSVINIDELRSIFINFGEIFLFEEYFHMYKNIWYLIYYDLQNAYKCIEKDFFYYRGEKIKIIFLNDISNGVISANKSRLERNKYCLIPNSSKPKKSNIESLTIDDYMDYIRKKLTNKVVQFSRKSHARKKFRNFDIKLEKSRGIPTKKNKRPLSEKVEFTFIIS